MKRVAASIATASIALLVVTGCAPHTKYRTVHPAVCTSPIPVPAGECETHALQQLPTGNGSSYLLGFVEFDDQGQLWDRKQMRDVVSKLQTDASARDLLMVVFVHGWKHSAAPGDRNIDTFRGVLAGLSDAESYLAQTTNSPPRQVVGVYLGWRGGSMRVPYLENLTFWDRKNTAQKVGHGGVTEVLSQLEDIKLSKDSMACRERPVSRKLEDVACGSNTRLVVVGHSFGGAVVHTALAQILENRFVQTTGPAGVKSNVEGFGNLVVLINPAFEANLFTPLSNMAAERTYFPTQLPKLLVLTSEADGATRYAFPVGRWFSTFFENEEDRQRHNAAIAKAEIISERDANVSAVGHFEPFRTHRLYPATERKREEIKATSAADSVQTFARASDDWLHDAPGSKISIGDVVLERTTNSAGHNPYLVTSVDGRLIRDHNDIDDPRAIEFVKQLILISSYNEKQTAAIREKLKPKTSEPPPGKP